MGAWHLAQAGWGSWPREQNSQDGFLKPVTQSPRQSEGVEKSVPKWRARMDKHQGCWASFGDLWEQPQRKARVHHSGSVACSWDTFQIPCSWKKLHSASCAHYQFPQRWWARVTPGYWLTRIKVHAQDTCITTRTPHVALYFHTYPLGLEPTSSYQHVLHFYYLENECSIQEWCSIWSLEIGFLHRHSSLEFDPVGPSLLLLLDCGSVSCVDVCVNPSFHLSGTSACEYSCWVIRDLYAF